jgi:hypothetical protein
VAVTATTSSTGISVTRGRLVNNSTPVVTSEPTTMAASQASGFSTPPGTNRSKMPPWGTTVDAPAPSEIAPAVADPTTRAGMTRIGSRAANGMAPSVMNDRPSTKAGLPASCSSLIQRPGNRMVAMARPIGGVMPAAITAAIGAVTPLLISPTANVYATLSMGPPMSLAIIAPGRTPAGTA